MEFPQKGGCLCGAVRFELRAAPMKVAFCHCQSCRRATGAPVSVYADCRTQDVVFTRGEMALFESSPGVRRGFCATCGATLSWAQDAKPEEIDLHAGAFDNAALFIPAEGQDSFPEERLPWLAEHLVRS
ncbi:MAG: GFA family protein [Hyphomonadaceae bacterium]